MPNCQYICIDMDAREIGCIGLDLISTTLNKIQLSSSLVVVNGLVVEKKRSEVKEETVD